MRVLAIGRIGRGPERDLFERYARRLRPSLEVTEFTEARGTAAEIKRREAKLLLDAVPAQAFLIALDEGGDSFPSTILARTLEDWLGRSRTLCFAIGGAEGLDRSVMARADRSLSLGPLTWPHLLARALLAEQLYRARAITTGHPYHRPGRP